MITRFITQVRSRLNFALFLRCLLTCLAAVSIGVILIGIFGYIMRGDEIALPIYQWATLSVILSSVLTWWIRRKSKIQAAVIADHHFHLKDALSSSIEFANESGEVYQLQQKQTETLIHSLSPKRIPLYIPSPLAWISALSLLAAISLSFVPASAAVLKQREEKQETLQRTQEIQKALSKNIEEMIESLDEDEKKVLAPDELRKWVKNLKATEDPREALRNYARLEQKLQKKINQLDQRKEEALLKNAALKMQKSSQSDTKNMGKTLDKKQFKKAAEDLKKFKLKDAKDKKLPKNTTYKQKKQKLHDAKTKLAKLRNMSKRLAEAAREQKKQRSGGNSSRSNRSGSTHGKGGDEKNGGKSAGEQELEEMLGELDEAAEELDEELEEMELELEQGEEWGEDWEDMMQDIDGKLGKLKGKMRRMHGRRKAKNRLKSLRSSISKAQSYANRNSSSFQRSLGSRALEAGKGTDSSRRKEKDTLENNGQYDKLDSKLGKGPSLSKIEEADSGTGSSTRKSTTKQRTFQQQMHSFVERDDIPEEMKSGVKEYFKNIHQHTQPDNQTQSPPTNTK